MTALPKTKPEFGFESALIAKIQQSSIRHLSIDVFDTLVFRRVANPSDIFSESFKLLNERHRPPINEQEYRVLRENAERKARLNNPNSEISLTDIVNHLPFTTSIKESVIQAELATEEKLAFLNHDLIECIQSLRLAGLDIALISDMYLSESTIRSTFFDQHPVLSDIPLYVSCDIGCSKKMGELFTVVARDRNWSPEKWLHVGDNLSADVDAPTRQGIHCLPFFGNDEYRQILKIERNYYGSHFVDTALRIKSAADSHTSTNPAAFHLGAFIWGPLFLGFADWCIQKCLDSGCRTIVCLMREGTVFCPLIKLRLSQMNIQNISVKTLYASRKSTFWAAINTTEENWKLNVIDQILGAGGSSFRSYTIRDFYLDAGLVNDDFSETLGHIEVRKIESVYYRNDSALIYLKHTLMSNHGALEDFINDQKSLFHDYFRQEINTNLSSCCIVDLGNGGTISHYLERILQENAMLNLLFYASDRIYRFSPPLMASGFLAEHNCQYRTHKLLQRSQESIEPLLVGARGSCSAYQRNENHGKKTTPIEPLLSAGIENNKPYCDAFFHGLETYFYNSKDHFQAESYQPGDIEAILARYLNFPTEVEAELFTHIKHEDNFGSRRHYSVVDAHQLDTIKQHGIENAYSEYYQWRKWKQGEIHWPQGVFTLLDKYILTRRAGLLSSDNTHAQSEIFRKIQESQWSTFSAYGAGEFFEQSLVEIKKRKLEIQCAVDKKAEIKGHYQVHAIPVVDLHTALTKGYTRFAIFSLAFQTDIIELIQRSAQQLKINNIEIISSQEERHE